MKDLAYAAVELLVTKDFDEFDYEDKPMKTYCAYSRSKHIQLATQLVTQYFGEEMQLDATEVENFIHNLNHLFFNGFTAGQSFENFRR